ncbi:MAG: type 1 glutamine amidotransferase domain-containing protein [Bacteroidota bacterium]
MKYLPLILLLLASCQASDSHTSTELSAEEEQIAKDLIQGAFDEIWGGVDSNAISTYHTDDFIILENGEIWDNDRIKEYIRSQHEREVLPTRVNRMEFISMEKYGSSIQMAYDNFAEFYLEDSLVGKAYWLESALAIETSEGWRLKMMHSTWAPYPTKKKALFVCTSVDEVMGNPNGTFLSEIAVPFIMLKQADFEIDIVSPNGGAIPIYYKFDTTELISQALASDYYVESVNNSLTPDQIDAEEYDAVIIPGGYGQFWDIHSHEAINQIIAQIYENDGVVGALGHGTSSLVNVKLSNGDPMVKGKTMTCFPSWFERELMVEADYGRLLPFDMEMELESRGANLLRVDKETRSNGEIVDADNRLVTASLATSGEFIATQVMSLLGVEQ